MDEISFSWRILDALARSSGARTPIALATLTWLRDNRKLLKLKLGKGERLSWRDIPKRAAAIKPETASPLHDQCISIARALHLDPVDTELLWFLISTDRHTLPRTLAGLMVEHRIEPAIFWAGQLCTRQSEGRLRITKGDLERLGLIRLTLSRGGLVEVEPSWTLNRLLNQTPVDLDDGMLEILIGRRQIAALALSRFGRISDDADLIASLLRGALDRSARGINILLYGPPGTGKTELARSIAQAAGGQLFSVGEVDEYDEEPNRWDRIAAYRMAQRVGARRKETLLLFDEMEDLIGDAQPGAGDSFRGREGSKIYVNRLLETNPVPTLWTTNTLGNVDPAILRRMSFVLKVSHVSSASAEAMLEHVAAEENVQLGRSLLRPLTVHAPDSTTILRNALRSAHLAGDGADYAQRTTCSLLSAVRGGKTLRLPKSDSAEIDLSLLEADRSIDALMDDLTAPGAPSDFSLLLTGPPGTGKTALAHHMARRLDRPLIVKRASDLFSKWVGQTEAQIASAFDEALERDGVLLFDEVDSLLLDRSTARASWEVTQVNELLTQFDDHPLPFIAATNHAAKLDPAALRRFVFKLDFKAMSQAKAAKAWVHFFKLEPPRELAELEGLTPGDFAVVARQMRFSKGKHTSAEIVTALHAELDAKPGAFRRAGF